MVTVSSYAVRQNDKGESFVLLNLQGDLEFIQSKNSGKFYATSKKCSITSTFNEVVAQSLVGKQIPGKIIKQDCESYEFVDPSSSDIIELSYRWIFIPEGVKSERTDQTFKSNPKTFSSNGIAVEA